MVADTERHLTEPGLIELFVLTSAEAADPTRAAHADHIARAIPPGGKGL